MCIRCSVVCASAPVASELVSDAGHYCTHKLSPSSIGASPERGNLHIIACSALRSGSTVVTCLLIGCSTHVSVFNLCSDVGALSQLVMSSLDPNAGVTLPVVDGEDGPTEEGISLFCLNPGPGLQPPVGLILAPSQFQF